MLNVARNEKRQDGEEEFEITEDFRDALRRWMDAPANNVQVLADQVGCHRTVFGQIRDGKINRTKHLENICKYTGIPFPHPHLQIGKLWKEIDDLVPGLSHSELTKLQEMIQRLKDKAH